MFFFSLTSKLYPLHAPITDLVCLGFFLGMVLTAYGDFYFVDGDSFFVSSSLFLLLIALVFMVLFGFIFVSFFSRVLFFEMLLEHLVVL